MTTTMKTMAAAMALWAMALGPAGVHAEGVADARDPGNLLADTSYAFGMAIGSDLRDMGLRFNYPAFTRGMREIMEGSATRFTMDEAMDLVQTAYEAAMAAQAAENRERGEQFLAENAARPGVTVTATGLQYEVLVEGDGPRPAEGDYVRVRYRGSLVSGEVFDSSYERDESDLLPLDAVIPGWREGLMTMRAGGRSRLYIPSGLAYGEEGAGGAIPPNAALIFEVDLIEVITPPEF